MTLSNTLNDEQLRALGAAMARRRVLADVEMMRRRAREARFGPKRDPLAADAPSDAESSDSMGLASAQETDYQFEDCAPLQRPVLIDPMGPARGLVRAFILGLGLMALAGLAALLIVWTAR